MDDTCSVEDQFIDFFEDRVYKLPKDFQERCFEQQSIQQNQLLYNLIIRLRQHQKNYVDSCDSNNHVGMNQYFSYHNNYRSLINDKYRQGGEYIMKINRNLLIDQKKAHMSDFIQIMRTNQGRKNHSKSITQEELSQMGMRVLYLFQQKFIKKHLKSDKRKLFKKIMSNRTIKTLSQCNKFTISAVKKDKIDEFYKTQIPFEDLTERTILEEEILNLYLQILPQSYRQLPYMGKNIEWFTGDMQLTNRCKIKQSTIEGLFQYLKNLFTTQAISYYFKETYGQGNGQILASYFEKQFTIENIAWCYNVISTRSFSIHLNHRYKVNQQISFLSPFVDLLNHSNDPNCEWGYNEQEECFYLSALDDIQEGDELTIRYGNINNLNLFINYGIAIEGNEEKLGICLQIKTQQIYYELQALSKKIGKRLIPNCLCWLKKELHHKGLVQSSILDKEKHLTFKMSLKSVEKRTSQILKRILRSFYIIFSDHASQEIISDPNIAECQLVLRTVIQMLIIKIAELKAIKQYKMRQIKQGDTQTSKPFHFIPSFLVILLQQQIQVCDQLDSGMQNYLTSKSLAKKLNWQNQSQNLR